MINKKSVYLISLISTLILFITFDSKLFKLDSSIFTWDEINYVKASKIGFLENYLESKSKNFFEFIKIGKLKLSNQPIEKIISTKKIKDLTNNDTFQLRHFHPPLYVYYLSFFLNDIHIEEIEIEVRKYHKYIGYFIIFLYLIIFYQLTKKSNLNLTNIIIFFLIIFNFFYSEIFQTNLKNLNFHTFFSLISILYFYSILKFLIKKNFKNILRLSLSISLLFISLETAIFYIFFTFLYFIFFNIKERKYIFNYLFIIFLSLIIFIIIWPANIFNLSIIKTYLMYFYRIFLSSYSEYENIGMGKLLSFNLINNFNQYTLFFIIICISLFKFKYLNKKYYILVLFNLLLYFLFIILFSHHSNYIFPSFVILNLYAILLFFGTKIIINNLTLKFSIILIFFALSFFTFNSAYKKNFNLNLNSNTVEEIVNINRFIYENNNNLNKKDIILADGAHIFNFYLNNNFLNLELYNNYTTSFHIRIDYNYYDINNLIIKKDIPYIIIAKSRKININKINYLINIGYKKINFPNYYLFQLI